MARYAKSINMTVGNLRPIVTHFLQEEDTGAIIDLTTAVSVVFSMSPLNEDGSLGTVKIDKVAAVIATASTGKVTYTWTGTDTDTAGIFRAWFIVYWGAASTLPEDIGGITVTIFATGEKVTV